MYHLRVDCDAQQHQSELEWSICTRCVEGDEEERRRDLNAAKAHLARVLQTEAVKTAVLAEAEERRRRHNMEGELEGELYRM